MNLTGKYFKKKGGISDLILYIIIIVVIAVVSLVSWKLMKILDDNFQNNSLISSEGKSLSSSLRSRFTSVVDNAFLIVLVGFLLAIVVGASVINTHPALYWISIPILVFLVFWAAIYSNFFTNFYQQGGYTAEINDLSIIKFVMDNYVIFVMGAVLLVSFVLFAKSRQQTAI